MPHHHFGVLAIGGLADVDILTTAPFSRNPKARNRVPASRKKLPWEKTIFLSLGEAIFHVRIVDRHLKILIFPVVSS
jgi:hypothetical protein